MEFLKSRCHLTHLETLKKNVYRELNRTVSNFFYTNKDLEYTVFAGNSKREYCIKEDFPKLVLCKGKYYVYSLQL